MDKETTKMIPGDELHLTMLMAPYSLNLVTGQDRQHLLAFGRAAFEAGKADRTAQCLHHIAEPETAASMLRQCIGKATFPTNMDKHSALQWIDQLEAEVDAERRHHGIRNASAVRTLHELGYSWRGADAWHPAAPQAAPFMWAIQEPGGGAYMDEGCVSSVREDVQAEVDGLNSGLDADDDPYKVVPVYLAAAPQAVQAAEPEGWKLAPIKVPDSAFAWVSGGYPAGFKAADKRDTAVVHERAQRTWEAILNGITAPAHPAEGVPPQASEWDGKLPERLQSVLNALRLELPAAVVNDVEFEVRSHYEAMHTSLSTSRRMYGAARDRLEAIDAAQPDPFAATQPAAQGMDAKLVAFIEKVRDFKAQAVRVGSSNGNVRWDIEYGHYGAEVRAKTLPDAIDAALAAQAKQGGAANG